jgi:hypothetical protein
MSWYREGPGGHQRMVMNGVPGRYFSRVSRPVLHADAGTFVYTAQDQRGFYVVTPLGVSGELPGVQWNPRISDDGTRTGYATVIGNQIVWKVAPLR